jgi:hypothetical protein
MFKFSGSKDLFLILMPLHFNFCGLTWNITLGSVVNFSGISPSDCNTNILIAYVLKYRSISLDLLTVCSHRPPSFLMYVINYWRNWQNLEVSMQNWSVIPVYKWGTVVSHRNRSQNSLSPDQRQMNFQVRHNHFGLSQMLGRSCMKFNLLAFNPLTPELNPSAQRCLTRYFYWGFCFLNHAFR